MENNNLLNEVQVNEVIDEGVQVVETIQREPQSDFTKNLLLVGAGALLATTPLVYKKVIKPGFKKLFGKKNEQEKVIDVEVVEVEVEEQDKDVKSDKKEK